MRRIYLVRHADVRYADDEGRAVPVDSVNLTEEGRSQARALRDALARVPLDRAIVSGLPAHRGDRRDRPRRADPALRDPDRACRRSGRAASTSCRPRRLQAEFTQALHKPVGPDDRFLNGETWGAMQARALPCFHEILADPAWSHLLVVGHGGVNRVLLLEALGLGPRGPRHARAGPGVPQRDRPRGGRGPVVRLLNHTAHDPAKETLVETTMQRLYRSFKP